MDASSQVSYFLQYVLCVCKKEIKVLDGTLKEDSVQSRPGEWSGDARFFVLALKDWIIKIEVYLKSRAPSSTSELVYSSISNVLEYVCPPRKR